MDDSEYRSALLMELRRIRKTLQTFLWVFAVGIVLFVISLRDTDAGLFALIAVGVIGILAAIINYIGNWLEKITKP